MAELTAEFREARAQHYERRAVEREAELISTGFSPVAAREGTLWHRQRAHAERERFERVEGCGLADVWIECTACGCCSARRGRCRCALLCVSCRCASNFQKRGAFLCARAAHLALHGGLAHLSRGWRRWTEKFLTLTAPHLSTDTIGSRISRVVLAFPLFMRSMNAWLSERDAESTAWFRVFEWTPGKDLLGHPHVHLWLFCPFLDPDLVLEWWRRALNATGTILLEADSDLIVDLRRCDDQREVAAELIKYLTKDIDECGRKLAPAVYAQVYEAFTVRRSTQGSRGFMALSKKSAGACVSCGDTSPRKVYPPGQVPSDKRMLAIQKVVADLSSAAVAPLAGDEREQAYRTLYGKAPGRL